MDLSNLRFEYDYRLEHFIKNEVLSNTQVGRYKEEYFHYRRRLLLGNSVKVTKDLLPNVYQSFQQCLDILGGNKHKGELYVHQSGEYNANVLSDGHRFDVLVNSGLIKDFSDEEIRFVFGHELGHVIYHHDDIPVSTIVNSSNSVPEETERILFKWSRSAEISADRVGLLCSGSLESAVSALFKTSSGLTTITPDKVLHSYREQYDELKNHIEQIGGFPGGERTHPMTAIRFKALEMASLDMIALRSNSRSFSWDSFRKLDADIANVIDGLENSDEQPLVSLTSENGQVALFTALLYVALAEPSVSWNHRSLLHDIKEELNSILPIESMIEDAAESILDFRRIALSDLESFFDSCSTIEAHQITQLCFLMASVTSNDGNQCYRAAEEVANIFNIDVNRIVEDLLELGDNTKLVISRILR